MKIALVAVALGIGTWSLDQFTNVNFIGPMAYGLLVFFFVFSVIAVFLSQNALTQNNHRQFLTAISGSMVAKVLLTAFVVLVFALVDRPKSVLVILPLAVYYVVFTAMEVTEFMKLNRKATLK